MHLPAKAVTLFAIVTVVIAFLPQAATAFQQPQRAEPTQSDQLAVKVLVIRMRALGFVGRYKEALNGAETPSTADVTGRLVTEFLPLLKEAQQALQKYPSVSAVVGSASIGLGDYDAAIQALGQTIRSYERVNSAVPVIRESYLVLADEYRLRAVANSATGNRIGSQRDFQTALELCRKADCEGILERQIYISRAMSSFVLGDLSPAGQDCGAISQFGRSHSPVFEQELEEVCAYILSGAGTQPVGGDTTGSSLLESIRSEIDQVVRTGKYTPLPPIQATGAAASRGGIAVFEVRNDTAYTLTTLFSGPVERRVEVAPGTSTSIELTPGAYKIVGRVNAPDVLPSYGEHTFSQGDSGLRFFLQ